MSDPKTILVVDDDFAVRGFARLVLERDGYRVIEAHGGGAALRCWEEHGASISLVITDLIMPGEMSGLEVAVRLRRLRPGLGVVFTSGRARDPISLGSLISDGSSFLEKPFTPKQLATIVRQQLEVTAG